MKHKIKADQKLKEEEDGGWEEGGRKRMELPAASGKVGVAVGLRKSPGSDETEHPRETAVTKETTEEGRQRQMW